MAGFARVKSLFFDRAAVIGAMDKATLKALSRAGAFLRTRARSSMRRRKKSAAAGAPPSVHAGQLKDFLYFSWDPATRSVVVGPERFGKGEAPHLLEFGGTARVRDPRTKVTRTARYAGNPYMAPALAKEIAAGTLPECWRNSVRSS